MRIFRILLLPIDFILAAVVGGLAIIVAFFARFRKERNKKIIFLVPGADIQSIHQKYGTLNVYLQDDPDYFDYVYRFLWGKQNVRIKLRENFTVIERKVGPPLRFFSMADLFFCMALTLLREKASLIHARDPYFCGFIAYLLAKISGRLFCISIHTDYEKCELTDPGSMPKILGSIEISRFVERVVLKNATMILPISDYLKNVIAGKGIPVEKMRIFYHAIDLHPFEGQIKNDIFKKFKLKVGSKIVSSVSRIDKQHYSPDVLEIALRVIQEEEDVCFLICGDGVLREALMEKIEKLGVGNRIIMPGWVDNELVADIRRQSYINLCLYDGISLIEACAAGNPIIAYDIEWNY